jgi:hypothetical protein
MDEDKSGTPEPIACPICQRPLRATSGHPLSALECEQCGPFSDFTGSAARRRAVGSDHQGHKRSGPEPTR